MRRLPRFLAVAGAVGAAAFLGATATLAAQASDQPPTEQQPSTVEDYAYPGADAILKQYGVKLIAGDGHILFAECSSGTDLIRVRTNEGIGAGGKGAICFRVTAPAGYLTLKVPAVYEIRGDGYGSTKGHKLKAELTTDAGEHKVVDVNPNGSTQVGVSTEPPGEPTTLLRLDASS
ncbi:hypothetical protein [Streptoalloteichus hindustanus]|uniref:Secreted protein n=1 Tax=Streptoalloteichus hindustanus TaxID=2017 RepID=A0A1M4Y4K0_STRHI|nr:hypothetical protein [Streptoalloteichus hindustanus]SHF00600.1 hypothetical protein SAMN05444320_102231 [Streptoalloteichus hindustanus]